MSENPVTLRFQVQLDRTAHAHKIVLSDAPRPSRVAPGNVPRIARLLALAHHLQNLLDDGVVKNQRDLAELAGITRPRVTQILNLLLLAPDIQEQILFLPRTIRGHAPISERTVRYVMQTPAWNKQRERWKEITAKLS